MPPQEQLSGVAEGPGGVVGGVPTGGVPEGAPGGAPGGPDGVACEPRGATLSDAEAAMELVELDNAKIAESTEHPEPEVPPKQETSQEAPEVRPSLDFDDLLPHIGEFGLYQKCLFLLMIPFAFFVAFVYFAQIFITLTPETHWCKVPELANLSLEER